MMNNLGRMIFSGVLAGQTHKSMDPTETNWKHFTAQHLRTFLITFVQQPPLCCLNLPLCCLNLAMRHNTAPDRNG